jgi:hypothetical protein
MNERANNLKLRGILLGIIVLLSFNISACTTFLESLFGGSAEAAAEAEPAEVVAVEPEPMAEPEEMAPLIVSDDVHVVATGESLWSISGLSAIYNDPFRWPLIYARNKDIQDADLIYPGQELAIRRDLTRDDIDAAVMHAKNRGAWSINEIEETDTAFRESMM